MRLDLETEHDEWLAAKAMASHYARDTECTPARAIVRQAIEIERLIHRVERLRGALKWCSGRLLDANDLEGADMAMEMAGDMEPNFKHEGAPAVSALPLDALVGRVCWWDGKPAADVWATTWDDSGEDWPMCADCSSAVSYRLALRAAGRHAEADSGDRSHGIDTRGLAGRWIVPNASFSRGPSGPSAGSDSCTSVADTEDK